MCSIHTDDLENVRPAGKPYRDSTHQPERFQIGRTRLREPSDSQCPSTAPADTPSRLHPAVQIRSVSCFDRPDRSLTLGSALAV